MGMIFAWYGTGGQGILTDSASSRFDGSGRGSILLCSQHGDLQTAPAKRLSQPAYRTVQGRRCNGSTTVLRRRGRGGVGGGVCETARVGTALGLFVSMERDVQVGDREGCRSSNLWPRV